MEINKIRKKKWNFSNEDICFPWQTKPMGLWFPCAFPFTIARTVPLHEFIHSKYKTIHELDPTVWCVAGRIIAKKWCVSYATHHAFAAHLKHNLLPRWHWACITTKSFDTQQKTAFYSACRVSFRIFWSSTILSKSTLSQSTFQINCDNLDNVKNNV